jgi:mannose-6-phosphate isomerase-like protein (cupin superfamily)
MSKADAIAPDGSQIRLLVSDAARASLVEVTLPAGQASRPVRHRTVEEIWHFIGGQGEVWREGADVAQVRPGDSLLIPTGCAFQFRAGAAAALRFLCYTSPPWPGDQEAAPAGPGKWQPTV